ncbi:uncharacterized protein [Procambarus clarkii]|uniref:uncharacterized protein n=1 Tax=Procambarus clarkii TaxID=6728 RepID=UPI00374272DA
MGWAHRRTPQDGRGLSLRGTRPNTAGGPASTPSFISAGTHGKDKVTGATAGEDEDGGDVQRVSGRSAGPPGTPTRSKRPTDGNTTSGGEATIAEDAPGNTGGVSAAKESATSSTTESSPTRSSGKSFSRKRFSGSTASAELPVA